MKTLNLLKHKKFLKNKVKTYKRNTLRYAFNFRTILPPSQIPQTLNTVNLLKTPKQTTLGTKKVLIKQSYLILMWFKFLLVTKKSRTTPSLGSFKFFIKPKQQTRFTLTKSPMAQKTFSQEQYSYSYYSLVLSFSLNINTSYLNKLSLKSTLYLFSLVKNFLFFTETNLFFLQRLSLGIDLSDPSFFKLY